MGSDPLRAIVELVTNSDDAYEDTPNLRKGKIRIEVERHKKTETIIRVMDRAKGMTADEMVAKLAREGARTSGCEAGKNRLGLLGRGAKDIVHFGSAKWTSTRHGRRSEFQLVYDQAPTDRWMLDELGSADHKEHGTTATLVVQPRFTVSRYDGLRRGLSRHFGLRNILLDRQRRDVTLVDVTQRREDHLVYETPNTRMSWKLTRVVEVNGFPGCFATVSLFEATESLDDVMAREYWRHSLFIKSDRSGYEIFDGGKSSREPWSPYLAKVFGHADVPCINQLIHDYDNRIESGLPIDPKNPIRLVKRDRSGLVPRSEHPFVDSLYEALEGVLQPHLERLRSQAESKSDSPLNDETKRRLAEVGRLLGQLLQQESIESSLEGGSGALPPPGLTVVPTTKVVETNAPAYLLVRYRPHEGEDASTEVAGDATVVDEEGTEETIPLTLHRRNGYFSRSLKVNGRPEGAMSEVRVLLRSQSQTAFVEWKSRSFPSGEKLEFEHAGYTLKEGERRALKLLAPWDLVVHTDPRPRFAVTGDPSISLIESDSVFGFDHQRECGVCIVHAKGRGVGAKARVVAALGESVAESELAVSVGGVSGVNISFEEMNIEQRAIIDGSTLKINARHPAIARYLGPKRKNWPGQNAVHFRTMLAEIIAWAFARHVVQQRLHQDRQDVYRLFYEHMQLMDKWLPRLHGMLVPARELALPADH